MRVLIVDDNPEKVSLIREVIDSCSNEPVLVDQESDAAAAARRLSMNSYDLLVLDLNIPMRQEQRPTPDGGANLLRELKRRKTLRLPRHILGLTEFEELQERHRVEFDDDLWHLVRFDRASNEWVEKLRTKVSHIVDADLSTTRHDYDIAIITALHEVELEAVLKLDAGWKTSRVQGDYTVYHVGEFRRGEEKLRVVAASSIEMGMPAAAALSMKMIGNFRPRLLAMCGIAAGVKGNFGDILVADRCWDYGSGKHRYSSGTRKSRFLPEPTQIPVSSNIKDAVANFVLDRSVVSDIYNGWVERKPKRPIVARIGPFASGAAVLQNRRMVASIVRQSRKVIGVEMETYGVYMAAKLATQPAPEFVSIKSICDFGGKAKSDEYQRFAAYTSAEFLQRFAVAFLLPEVCSRPQTIRRTTAGQGSGG